MKTIRALFFLILVAFSSSVFALAEITSEEDPNSSKEIYTAENTGAGIVICPECEAMATSNGQYDKTTAKKADGKGKGADSGGSDGQSE